MCKFEALIFLENVLILKVAVYFSGATAIYSAVMALSIENIANWEVNISGYCSHIISVIEKNKKKNKTEKKLEPDS